MRPEELLAVVRGVPFRPFRIVMNSGKAYEIRHPEMIRVGRSTVYVFFADAPDRPVDHLEMVSLLLIERVEFIDASTAAPQ